MSWTTSESIDRRAPSLSEWTVRTARDVLDGRRRGLRGSLAFAGPALVASIAYMDPGNFATNIQAGAKYGYQLLWVVLLANVIAMLFQALSAKLGIVTGQNLAELCRERLPRPVALAMWAVSEIAAMATDLAEFLGGAIGLSLLFKIPLLPGMVVTAIVVYALLQLQRNGFRPIELLIGSLVATIGALLSDRDLSGAGRVGFGGVPFGGAATWRARGAGACRRHYRRNRDAARHLSPFRADASTNSAAKR